MDDPDTPPERSEESISGVIDRREFASHFGANYNRLWLMAASLIGDRSEADDIVQEAGIIAFQKLDQFKAGSSFSAWLAAIVRRCAANYTRKTRNRATYPADPRSLDFASEAENHVGPVLSSSGELLEGQMEFDDQVLRVLNSLNPQARCCLLLRTVQQLSYAEIAELMAIPEGTAMSHVHRSKSTMRRYFAAPSASRSVGEQT